MAACPVPAAILEIIHYNLTREGYDVYTAKDGNEALERARQIHPDLIILDIMMPYKINRRNTQ